MNTLPEQFITMLDSLPGHSDVAKVLTHTESPVAIRFNPAKPMVLPECTLQNNVPWEPQGIYLDKRPAFTFHTALYDGRFYVQDPSSMIVGEAVRRIVKQLGNSPISYLDACAAPGGKTTSAMANLPQGSFVLANEFDSKRILALIDNLARWGSPGYAVSRADASTLSVVGELFDIVAADVPCSGEGMMRKNSTAISQWSPALIKDCSKLQRSIVESVWNALRPGGFFIYSTCTFNTTENEENVRWMRDALGAIPVDMNLSEYPGVLPSLNADVPGARMLPGLVDGEGQFVAVLRKKGDWTPRKNENINNSSVDWVEGSFVRHTNIKGDVYAIYSHHLKMVKHLMSKTNVIVPGIHVASPKGRDLMPAQALATSLALRSDVFPVVNVDYCMAIDYLRGRAIILDKSVPKGYVLISHNNNRLGWAKNVGARANNLFPDGLRIRSSADSSTQPDLF